MTDSDILDTIAEVHLKRGNYPEALRSIQSALDIAPDDPDLKARKKEIEDQARRAPKKRSPERSCLPSRLRTP